MAGRAVVLELGRLISSSLQRLAQVQRRTYTRLVALAQRFHAPGGILARTWPSGSSALWMMVMLLALLITGYLA